MERSALDEAVECAERTLAAPSARIRAGYEMDFSVPESKPRRRGGLLRPLLRLAGAAARRGWNYVGRSWSSFSFEGFIEPSRRRCMMASPKFAVLWRDAKRWSGNPGQPLSALTPARGSGAFLVDVWFLLDALRGLERATVEGEDDIRATACTRLAVRVDLGRASAAAPDGIHPPSVDRFEDLLELPLTVSIDGTHVRRVRFEEEEPSRSWEIELWDFGVATEGLDWSRLPAFDAGGEASKGGSRGRLLTRRLQRRRTSPAAS